MKESHFSIQIDLISLVFRVWGKKKKSFFLLSPFLLHFEKKKNKKLWLRRVWQPVPGLSVSGILLCVWNVCCLWCVCGGVTVVCVVVWCGTCMWYTPGSACRGQSRTFLVSLALHLVLRKNLWTELTAYHFGWAGWSGNSWGLPVFSHPCWGSRHVLLCSAFDMAPGIPVLILE